MKGSDELEVLVQCEECGRMFKQSDSRPHSRWTCPVCYRRASNKTRDAYEENRRLYRHHEFGLDSLAEKLFAKMTPTNR